jgi:hypothetical protein
VDMPPRISTDELFSSSTQRPSRSCDGNWTSTSCLQSLCCTCFALSIVRTLVSRPSPLPTEHVTHPYPPKGNARLAGFDTDLGLTGYDYNHVLSVFYISYIIFEIPCNLCCKWMGPGWFLPISTLLFGVASIATAFVNTIHQASGVRFVLGIFEAGMVSALSFPDVYLVPSGLSRNAQLLPRFSSTTRPSS